MWQGRSGNHKTEQKLCRWATVKEIGNLKIIKGGNKMAATPAPFLGAPLFRRAHPISGAPLSACGQDLNFKKQKKHAIIYNEGSCSLTQSRFGLSFNSLAHLGRAHWAMPVLFSEACLSALWQGVQSTLKDQNVIISSHNNWSAEKEQRSWPRRPTVNSKYMLTFSCQSSAAHLNSEHLSTNRACKPLWKKSCCNIYINCFRVIITTSFNDLLCS